MKKDKYTIMKEQPTSQPIYNIGDESDRSDLLPTLAFDLGFRLFSVTYDSDPFILYNRYGQIVYEWPNDYQPHWAEIYNICQKLLETNP